nr:MAG TPA: hypothetical protein [Caudoviricetes sp.]
MLILFLNISSFVVICYMLRSYSSPHVYYNILC